MTRRILFLPRYDALAASCRHRVIQYLPYLQGHGFDCTVAPFFSNAYVSRLVRHGNKSPAELVRASARRLTALLTAHRYDLVVIHIELFPYLPPIAESLLSSSGIPFVLDFDDAFFHRYEQHPRRLARWLLKDKICQIIKKARLNMAGSTYLAEYARACGGRTEVVPTVVDLARYPVSAVQRNHSEIRIGWIGTPSTTQHLQSVIPELSEFNRAYGARVLAIGARQFDAGDVPIEWVEWQEGTEVEQLARADVGIMPLPDTLWARGKCGFKLIQSMACWKPVVASPVGANLEIVDPGRCGFLAAAGQWREVLSRLAVNVELRERMGQEARRIVERRYALDVWAPRVAELLTEAANQ